MNIIKIEYASLKDIPSWIELVRTINSNFPGLETEKDLQEYEQTVIDFTNKKSSICAKEGDNVVGVLLFSKEHNMLCCIGVSPKYRYNGIATKMVNLMLENLNKNKDITVSTFREGDEKGVAARAFYKKLGFVEDELIEEFGHPCQKFILRLK